MSRIESPDFISGLFCFTQRIREAEIVRFAHKKLLTDCTDVHRLLRRCACGFFCQFFPEDLIWNNKQRMFQNFLM